jgi:two-component system, cell cycle sensor histidine kinase and response regulator CckA
MAAGKKPPPREYRIIRSDGAVRHIYRESEIVYDEAGKPAYLTGIIQDITEERQAEERQQQLQRQLAQAQKMEAIGNLTGGMAHDFNNLLGIVIGNLDLLRELRNTEGAAELIEDALEAALRGADLTRRLLAFARRQPLKPERTDINELMTGITALLKRTLREDIQITLKLAPDLWPAVVDPAQLEAALTNLANNARDAMPDGGDVIIVTRNEHLDEDYTSQHADLAAGDYALIEVTDTGTGMTPDVASHIFEPFYTTKEEGRGTGLGLAMVFGFMKQSGGHINVYSESGVGTTFRLYLPRTDAGETAAVAAVPDVARGAGQTVLAVEDNDRLRRIVARQLAELGYRVLVAAAPRAAIEILEHEIVQLVFSDVVMPGGMSGYDLARVISTRWPATKIILTSGFPDARIHQDGGVPNLRLLSKPYRRDELAQALSEALVGG